MQQRTERPAADAAAEEQYWKDEYSARPYVPEGASYDDYGPAYCFGVDCYAKYRGRDFDEVEADLAREWDSARGSSRLTWNEARYAAKDSFERVRNALERDPAGIAAP